MSNSVKDILSSKAGVACLTAVAVGSLSAALSHILTKKHVEKKWEKLLDEEIEKAKAYYTKLNKSDEYSDPIKLAEVYEKEKKQTEVVASSASQLITQLGYSQKKEDPEEERRSLSEATQEDEVRQSIQRNIFEEGHSEDDFDPEKEEAVRSKDKPYIISKDEFLQCEFDFSQTTLTYFESDDVLVDDADQPIRSISPVVGSSSNLKFGFGSGDLNIVYIRNHNLDSDFEVIRSHGSYSEEVLGFVEADETPKVRKKFKNYDD